MASVWEVREQLGDSILSSCCIYYWRGRCAVWASLQMREHLHTHVEQRTTYESQYSPSAMWVQGNEHKLLCGEGRLYSWVISMVSFPLKLSESQFAIYKVGWWHLTPYFLRKNMYILTAWQEIVLISTQLYLLPQC